MSHIPCPVLILIELKKMGGGGQNNSANRHLWKNNKTVANKMKVSDEELKNGAEFLVAGPEVTGQSL